MVYNSDTAGAREQATPTAYRQLVECAVKVIVNDVTSTASGRAPCRRLGMDVCRHAWSTIGCYHLSPMSHILPTNCRLVGIRGDVRRPRAQQLIIHAPVFIARCEVDERWMREAQHASTDSEHRVHVIHQSDGHRVASGRVLLGNDNERRRVKRNSNKPKVEPFGENKTRRTTSIRRGEATASSAVERDERRRESRSRLPRSSTGNRLRSRNKTSPISQPSESLDTRRLSASSRSFVRSPFGGSTVRVRKSSVRRDGTTDRRTDRPAGRPARPLHRAYS